MKKNEVLKHIDKLAKANGTNGSCASNARACISLLKIGATKLLVWEADRVSFCASVRYCVDPKKYDVKGITKVTKTGRGEYDVESIDSESIELGKLYN